MQLKASLALLLTTLAVLSAPGDVHKGNLTFIWDPPEPDQNVHGYILYVSTNLPPGIVLPIDEESLLSVTLPPASTNTFTPLLTIPGNATQVTLTNIWSQLGSWAFFAITATNTVGESPFSNPAALIAPLSGRGGLYLRLGQ